MILAKDVSDMPNLTLADAPKNGIFNVAKVHGPDQRRLCELGFIEGARLRIINRTHGGMMVVKVGGSRLGMANGMASCIMVK